MENELRILGVGTMRTGSSLVNSILTVHSKIIIFHERVQFFRFIYGKYDPLTPKNVERMLHHLRIRMDARFDTPLDVETVHEAIIDRGISYQACYDEIMKHMVRASGKDFWGDFISLGWRHAPYFINAFPGGRVYHIYRDPRGVLASWKKMTFQPDNLYLNGIFNWIDSVQHLKRYRETLSADRYYPIRFEDIHHDPEGSIRKLCAFLGVEFEDNLIHGERWEKLFDARYVHAPASSHTRDKVFGFDTKRTESWRGTLEEWELTLIEFFLGDLMEELGYERALNRIDPVELRHGLTWLTRNPVTLKHLTQYLSTGEGTDQATNDAADPRNWAARGLGGFSRFVDTPDYQAYLDAIDAAEAAVNVKYDRVGTD